MGRHTGLLLLACCALALSAAPAAAHEDDASGESIARQGDPLASSRAQAAVPTREEPAQNATPRAQCGPGARPEPSIQGRVPADAVASGDAEPGYFCNLSLLGREGTQGGYKVERFVDRVGRECAYYDTTLLFPTNALSATLSGKPTGVAVLDMSDPARPVRTATLVTPAMQSPHESLLVNQKRGLLAAVMGNPLFAPGVVDIYDLNADCRRPRLQSSSPVGLLGHESGFAPDGRTFYATSIFTGMVTAVDVTDPKAPSILGVFNYPSHGLTVSDDGDRGYVAGVDGLQVVDLSEVQARRRNPRAPQLSSLTWKSRTIPQVAIPVTIGGRPMLVEVDEFSAAGRGGVASNGPEVGAARIIDISDERAPRVVSNLRLAVHQPENRAQLAGDPGAGSPAQGYAAHYCSVPTRVDPGIVACSFIASGLRVFDIRDPTAPKELAYFVAPPGNLGGTPLGLERSNYAMSKPAFDVERGEIWYSDGNSGFYALKVAKGVWPFEAAPSRVGLPSARRCLSRRAFTVRLRAPRGAALRSAVVRLDGRRVRVRRQGRRLTARVDLAGRPKVTAKLSVVARTPSGRVVRETRRYRTCAKRR